MVHTVLYDAATGKTRTISLDASFGCGRRTTTSAASEWYAWRVHEVIWNRARYGTDMQSEKHGTQEAAVKRVKQLRRKGYHPQIIQHTSGTHTVIA